MDNVCGALNCTLLSYTDAHIVSWLQGGYNGFGSQTLFCQDLTVSSGSIDLLRPHWKFADQHILSRHCRSFHVSRDFFCIVLVTLSTMTY